MEALPSWKDYYSVIVTPKVEADAYARLPFEDEGSNQSEKTTIVRGHPEVSGDIFPRISWQVRQQ
jgi:hypothetical protein